MRESFAHFLLVYVDTFVLGDSSVYSNRADAYSSRIDPSSVILFHADVNSRLFVCSTETSTFHAKNAFTVLNFITNPRQVLLMGSHASQ